MLFFLFLFMPGQIICGFRNSVDMPKVAHPISMRAADREDAIIIAINREGMVFFGTDPVEAKWLHERIG